MRLLILLIKIVGISFFLSYIWFDGYDMFDKLVKISIRWIIIKLFYLFLLGVVLLKIFFGLYFVIFGYYFSGVYYIRGGFSELVF